MSIRRKRNLRVKMGRYQWLCKSNFLHHPFVSQALTLLSSFIGDGISDLAAAGQSDVLFARRGLALEKHCIANKIEHIPYDSFSDIQREIMKIAKIDQEKTKGQGLPARFNPRANMWRRVSSKTAVPAFRAMTPQTEERAFLWPETFTRPGMRSVKTSA